MGIRELDLFTGAGGAVLSAKLLGFKTVGYVEWDEYCQQIIRQRIDDGIYDEAPIFSDIDTFISEGYARRYRGLVDCISAGFPCQPHSRSGTHTGEHDDRNKWPETLAVIRNVRPPIVRLENNPGNLDRGYGGRVVADLAKLGYVGSQMSLSALGLGGRHIRRRIWWVAIDSNTIGERLEGRHNSAERRKTTLGSIQGFRENNLWLDLPNPEAFRGDNDVARRTDRLKAIGNGQVPIVAAAAFRILTNTGK